MEFELQTGMCDKCIGVDRCTKSCILHSGKALVDFIQRVDMVETRIGEYSSRQKDTKPDLVVYGHQLYSVDSPSWLLTDINTILDMSEKFKGVYDRTAFQVANIYCKHIGMTTEEIKEVTDKIKAINKNKAFVLPFKPHTSCNIDLVINNSLAKKKEAEITFIKWITNKETHKIECTLGFTLKDVTSTSITKIPITDYIEKFRLNQMEIQAKGNKHDSKIIQVTDYGIFKPILIKDGNIGIAVDGTYVYYISENDIHIIGFWNSKDNLVIDNSIKSKAITKIKENEAYIKNHKKYIAPYMMFEPNIIEIK